LYRLAELQDLPRQGSYGAVGLFNGITLISEEEFSNFIRALSGSENLPKSKVPGEQRADFLLNSRTIISGLKILEEDLSWKIGRLLHDRGIIFYGRKRLDSLISGRLDRDEINQEAYRIVTSSLERHFRKANQQIMDTAKHLKLANRLGLVIVINNGNFALEPHVVIEAASRLLMKQYRGKTKYSGIHGCLYFDEINSPRNLRVSNQMVLSALNIVATGGNHTMHYPNLLII